MIKINNKVTVNTLGNEGLYRRTLRFKKLIHEDTKRINTPLFNVGDKIYLESGVAIDYGLNLKVILKDVASGHLICEPVVF